MSSGSPRSLVERLWRAALLLLATAFVLSWAWALLQPLLSVLIIIGVLAVVGRLWLSRWRL
jgi:hypothetical protein